MGLERLLSVTGESSGSYTETLRYEIGSSWSESYDTTVKENFQTSLQGKLTRTMGSMVGSMSYSVETVTRSAFQQTHSYKKEFTESYTVDFSKSCYLYRAVIHVQFQDGGKATLRGKEFVQTSHPLRREVFEFNMRD